MGGGMNNQSKAILFVDDEEEILDILVDFFSDEGYDLYTATKAEEAMRILNKTDVDFVLSDLKLPDASGSELLNKVRDKNPDTVRVLTSGYLDINYGSICENRQDGTLYLSKPWDLSTLKKLVIDKLGQ